MTIAIHTDPRTNATTVQFTLSEDDVDRPVSVVGSFNDWTPGADPLLPQTDGTLGATITVSTAQDIHFRYLDCGGTWFDDPDAHEITNEGGVLHLYATEDPQPTAEIYSTELEAPSVPDESAL